MKICLSYKDKMDIIYLNKKLRKDNPKLAIFDVDWTLIKPKHDKKFPTDKDDWEWFRNTVPMVIKKYHRQKYRIVFVTDQSKDWKVDMIKSVILSLNIPIIALIAMDKEHHKPNPYLFNSFLTTLDTENSFYVGDAAGREGDWSDKDKEFAKNINVKFYTPEEIFPIKQKHVSIKKEKEVIIMIGYPGAGKSTIANSFHDYKIMNGDVFKTPAKMIQEAEKYIATQSIVFDATNGTKEKRSKYIEFAKKHNLPVRCIWVNTSIEQAMKQSKERGEPKIPDIAFYTFRKHFEEPTEEECPLIKIYS